MLSRTDGSFFVREVAGLRRIAVRRAARRRQRARPFAPFDTCLFTRFLGGATRAPVDDTPVIPSLARRGKLVLVTGCSFLLVGAMHASPPLAGFGALIVAALATAYLGFFPTAILLRRRKVELSWWVPPGDQPGGALAVDRPFTLHLALRNHGYRPLHAARIDVFSTAGVDAPRGLQADVPAGTQVDIDAMAVAHAAGYVVLHGAAIAFCDALGLFEVAAYFPNPIAIKVFPRAAGLRGAGVVRPRTGALHERVGAHYVRRRGLSGELREIRDHAHGDPFKFIAWKATARARRLMVRDLETEFVVTHQILLDIAGTMRHGAPGSTPLDYAIEVATGIARGAISGGDRVGLVTFDTRVYSQLRPGEGHRQFLQVVDRLVETRSVVDEDLTALTNAELVAAVARYLAHQEAIDVRLHRVPALDDPVWERVHAGPRGELYDIASMAAVVSKLLGQRDRDGRSAAAPAWWWTHVAASGATDPRLAQLRLFCRLRGIELPYRTAVEAGARAAGLADAVAAANAGPGRCDTAILLSDLAWFEPSAGRALEALALARRRGQPIVVVAPFGPAFVAPAATDAGTRALRIATAAARARFDEARRQLARRGVPAIEVGPSDAVADVVARIAGVRAASRRAA